LFGGRHFDSAAASPDGRFVFTSQWDPARAEVWDAHTGELLRELSAGQNWRGVFSPDGRWLATFSRDCQLWEVGAWRAGPAVTMTGSNQLTTSQGVPLGGGAAFSPDGKLFAVVEDLRAVRLIVLPEGRVVATLPTSGSARLQTLLFSGDGKLLAAATSRGEVHVWNLTALHARLGELQLDW
jgi:WD40 repeat protein